MPQNQSSQGVSFPHACGDVPAQVLPQALWSTFSPRVWGCTAGLLSFYLASISFPHACGDVPAQDKAMRQMDKFSPRVWGCTVRGKLTGDTYIVFPTRVGMYRITKPLRERSKSFPHACGDVPSPNV